jgi:hypothetical protein
MSFIAAAGPVAHIAAAGTGNETSITTMPESGLIILSICAIILACGLLLPPILAGRAPRQKGPASTPPWTGPVQGGVHLGDGRSVAPHRDAPAEAFDQETASRGQTAQGTVIRDDDEPGAGPASGSASAE